MPLVETLPVGSDTAQWSVWGTLARIVVTGRARVEDARHLVEEELAGVDRACSRFRPDAELASVGEPGRLVTPLLASLVRAALTAARRTGGDVDPTVGTALRRLGYDRDFAALCAVPGAPGAYLAHPAPGWRRVRLDGRHLTVPAGIELDLGATAKAVAADRCAALVASRLGGGVLVSLGGDLATAGAAPSGGWRVLVRDHPADPSGTVAVPAGAAMATSSTVSRTWPGRGCERHHILDPATGLPATPVWRTVTVAARSCVRANTASTAAVVRGRRALAWLRRLGVPARLVDAGGAVHTVGGWPAHTPAEAAADALASAEAAL